MERLSKHYSLRGGLQLIDKLVSQYGLRYLGRYTRRVAICNHRLVSFADGQVTFRWRDSAHHNEQELLTLSLDEFLRRFLLHILPQGFVRIRHFGFLADRKRATTLPLCFQLLASTPTTVYRIRALLTPLPVTFGSAPIAMGHGSGRKVQRCRDPTSFSTGGRRCNMKTLSPN